MASRSRSRKLSFDILNTATATSLYDDDLESILYRSNSDSFPRQNGDPPKPTGRKRNNRGSKKKRKKQSAMIDCSISEDSILDDPRPAVTENGSCRTEPEANCDSHSVESVNVCEPEDSIGTVRPVREATDFLSVRDFEGRELRQRSVAGGGSEGAVSRIDEEDTEESGCTEVDSVSAKQRAEPNGNAVRRLETAGSLDWKRLMAQDPNMYDILISKTTQGKKFFYFIALRSYGATILLPDVLSVEKSPWKYFMEELYSGNSLRSTTTLGNDKERERVYDTMFRLPWRCELLIDVGLFVCLDSFLSLLTIMPARILMTFGKLFKTGQFEKPSAAELSDFGCFMVLACGVALLEQTDISLIYHMIRGQGTIKLYVVYNVLEIFDKLCQNFGGDVLQTLFNTVEGLANCSPEHTRYWIWRFVSDEALAAVSSNILFWK
ncbi:hypothetical protein RHMOL_Rhmol09G0129600 [Rhododendron molle]|uniref:Uncharacterized protein n=1 Tax=Rhododendron molle TaxID=49168 RepID=A0ACC0MEN3_RHOML|nr:hypothetical protein RHMOL_Rhmol09G0129600 [Rhododendron molle]